MGWAVAVLCAACGVVRALGGCSNSSDTGDAGDDGGVLACGNPPYIVGNARMTSITTGQPVSGVTLTADRCPNNVYTTDPNGLATALIEVDAAINVRAQAPGYLTERVGEAIYRGDVDASAFLVPTLAAGALPHFSGTAPDILTVIYGAQPDAGAEGGAPCTSAAGATFSVVGHPEAVVTYYQPGVDGGLPTPDTALTATTSIGAGEISGLADGLTVTLQVSSPTCSTVSYVSYPLTGRYVLEANVLTVAPAFLVPTP
jgi:hypothetical protein